MARSSVAFASLAGLAFIARFASAQSVVTCNLETSANIGATCASFATTWNLPLAYFEQLNPGVVCPGNLTAGDSYCALGSVSNGTASSSGTGTATVTSTATATTATSTVVTPSPVMPNIVSDCDEFYLVATNDTCASIEETYDITSDSFLGWNLWIDADCVDLWIGYYVCVGATGGPITTTQSAATTITTNAFVNTTFIYPTTTSTPASNTVSSTSTVTSTTSPTSTSGTPWPLMPDIVSNCDQYSLVKSGDTCASLASSANLSLDDFISYNPYVGTNCDNLWVLYYVCTGVGASTTTTTETSATTAKTSTTTAATASTTTTSSTATVPSPVMPSIVSDCNKYFLVESGDGCDTIETAEGLTLAEFLSYNPYIDAACDNLWAGYYVCVGVS